MNKHQAAQAQAPGASPSQTVTDIQRTPATPSAPDPAAALKRLVQGNERFAKGEATPRLATPGLLANLADAQQPFATILGCSDSRVPPEILFDQGLGDLFIVRVAGNILGPETLGSMAYALEHLRTPLFVVLGHENCGAVHAALETRVHGAKHHARMAPLLNAILPALEGLDATQSFESQMRCAVEANVRRSVRQLAATPAGRAALAEGRIQLGGAIYQLETGRVRFLEENL
jgi:carbonic anhydrase